MQPLARIAKLLVGIDDSRQARIAQRHALHIARRMGAELVLAHACPRPEISRLSHRSPAVFTKLALPEMLRGAGPADDDGVQSDGVKISKLLIDGSPDPGIAEAANDCGADLVIVGTHGRSGIRRALFGSVAERTVRHANASVLVARGTAPAEGYRRILVPTDFSPRAEKALRLAVTLAAPTGTIELLHCWSAPMRAMGIPVPAGMPAAVPVSGPTPSSGPYGLALGPDVYELAMAEGRRLVALYRQESIHIDFALTEDRPLDAILERLAVGVYDLCALGSHGRKGLKRLLLGSVAEHIVRRAPCSVLVSHDSVTRRPRPRAP